MKLKIMTAIVMLVFLFPISIHAHGVEGKISSGGIVVTAEYADGEPMSYARVNISAPGSKLPFQSGRTDRNGRFCFFPDAPGIWKVVINDEIGHRLEIEVPVDKAMNLKTNIVTQDSLNCYLSKHIRVLMGICVIFGIFGCLLGWKGYKKAKAGNSKK